MPRTPPRRCWRRIAWRQGTKGALAARFAAIRVRVADGPTVREGKHLPGDEAWLVGEQRSGGERKFYLSNQPPRTALRTLAATIKARWVREQAHQQLKQELGLGSFEGRSWTGLHRHALMGCIAFAYTCSTCGSKPQRLGVEKLTSQAPPPRPTLPEIRRAVVERLFRPPLPPTRCPHCRKRLRPRKSKVPR